MAGILELEAARAALEGRLEGERVKGVHGVRIAGRGSLEVIVDDTYGGGVPEEADGCHVAVRPGAGREARGFDDWGIPLDPDAPRHVTAPSHVGSQGFLEGLKNDRTRRGFLLFGMSSAGDAETVRNVRAWLADFQAGQLERGRERGLPPFADWQEAFLAETDRRGAWTREQIISGLQVGMLDWWLEGRDPVACVEQEVRPGPGQPMPGEDDSPTASRMGR